MIPRKKPLARGGRIKPKKRKPSEFARIYGPVERIEFVNSLPCSVPPTHGGRIENAHSVTGGMGRKADASTILPLCKLHHFMLHQIGVKSFEERYGIDLRECAAQTEAAWQRHQQERAA